MLVVIANQVRSDIEMLSDFNDFLKILYKPRIAILFVLNDENNKDTQTYLDVKKFVADSNLDSYYEVVAASCDTLGTFCDIEENLAENFIYKAKIHQYDRFTFSKEDIQKLKDSIHFQLETIKEENSFDKFKSEVEPNETAVVFNFHEMNSIKEGKIEQTVIQCTSKCFKHDIKSYLIVDPTDFSDDHFLKQEENLNRVYLIHEGALIRLKSEEFIPEEVVSSINIETSDDVTELNFKNYLNIITHPIRNKIFLVERGTSCPDAYTHFYESAQHNRIEDLYSQRLLFVRINLNSKDEDTLTSANTFIEGLLGHDEINSDECLVLITKEDKNDTRKFLFEGEITKYGLIEFVNNFLDQRDMDQYYKSEPIPDANDMKYNIEKVVSKTFEEKAIRSQDDYFLAVLYEDNIDADIILSFVSLLKQQVTDLNFGYVIYKENEMEKLKTHKFPSFLFYKTKQKHQPRYFKEEFSYSALVDFFNENSNIKIDFTPEMKQQFLEHIKMILPEHRDLIEKYVKTDDFTDNEL